MASSGPGAQHMLKVIAFRCYGSGVLRSSGSGDVVGHWRQSDTSVCTYYIDSDKI